MVKLCLVSRSTKERKKIKKNNFLTFGFTMKNTKEKQINLKLVKN